MYRIENLKRLFEQADPMDRHDGMLAYQRYHDMMKELSDYYSVPIERVTAAFVALSPNSDYLGNLRSLVTMLWAQTQGRDPREAVVSTYKHCRERAALYLAGIDFLSDAKGPKTRAFYRNILSPQLAGPVTIDGHMYWAWLGENGTMKEAKVSGRIYYEISYDIRSLAWDYEIRPHEVQAILWYARKRILSIKYSPQLSLFEEDVGYQQATFSLDRLKPYGLEK